MRPELKQKQHDFREQTRNDKLSFDFAGASGSRVGPSRKAQKKRANTLDGPVSAMLNLKIIFGAILDVILELKMHPKSYGDSLWAPSLAILGFFWRDGK